MTNEQLSVLLMGYIRTLQIIDRNLADELSAYISREEMQGILLDLQSFIQSMHLDRRKLLGDNF